MKWVVNLPAAPKAASGEVCVELRHYTAFLCFVRSLCAFAAKLYD
ncbi:hypothetical protein [Moraxella caviae]|nr:hypothetical protein [Moraxella caviae]